MIRNTLHQTFDCGSSLVISLLHEYFSSFDGILELPALSVVFNQLSTTKSGNQGPEFNLHLITFTPSRNVIRGSHAS